MMATLGRSSDRSNLIFFPASRNERADDPATTGSTVRLACPAAGHPRVDLAR